VWGGETPNWHSLQLSIGIEALPNAGATHHHGYTVSRFSARSLFVASSAATLYDSARVG
jgi:hypothetical protein